MYHILANVYDRLQDIDYEKFADYYEAVFGKFGIKPKLVLDLGCGTGNITLPMAKRGYDMIGVDLSQEMLGIATEKAKEKNKEILFLNQDMTEFELYGTVGAMVSALDSINYLTEDGQLESMLKLLHYYLDPGGIFIFDINTEYKFKNILDGQAFVYDEDDVYCVWNNDYDEEEKICYFDLNFFLKDERGAYKRLDEYQEERAYSTDEIEKIIKNCNLELLGVYDNLSFNPPREDSERLFFVIKRPN